MITPEGLGPVRIGMTQAEALAALGPGWRAAQGIEPDDPQSCRHIVSGGPEGGGPILYMVEEGRVTRAEVDTTPTGGAADVRTERGLRVGASEDEVRQAYGAAVEATPHEYDDPPARYLTVWTRGGPENDTAYVQDETARGVRFVTDGTRRVVTIYAGGPSIQYVEGCA